MHLLRTSDVSQATLASVAPVFTVVSTCRAPDNSQGALLRRPGGVLSQRDFPDDSACPAKDKGVLTHNSGPTLTQTRAVGFLCVFQRLWDVVVPYGLIP